MEYDRIPGPLLATGSCQGSAGRRFGYDAWNRLISGDSPSIDFAYDALNRRIQEIRPSETRDLFYSTDWQLLEEQVEEVAVVHYVWSPVYVDALILRDGADSGDPQPVLYALQDANFNVTGLVDNSGSVQERYVYDPYGAVTYLTGNWGSRSASLYGWVYNHQGLRFVSDVGLDYNRNRDYSPTLMRFVQQDPIGFARWGNNNLYHYTSGNPLRWDDAWGLATEKECEAVKRQVVGTKWYQALQQQFQAAKCKMPSIVCDGQGKDVEPGTAGLYDADKNEVRIIYNIANANEFARTMIHELVHAYDDCQGLSKVRVDLRGRNACSELRAYCFSGQCNTPKGSGGYVLQNESPGDCLLRKAVDSISSQIKDQQFSPEEFVCCVWECCLVNRNVPGTGFYALDKAPDFPKKPAGCKGKDQGCQLVLGPRGRENLEQWFK